MNFSETKRAFERLCRPFSKSKNNMSEKMQGKMPMRAEPHQWVPQEAVLMSYPDGQARRAVFCKCAICDSNGAPLCTA